MTHFHKGKTGFVRLLANFFCLLPDSIDYLHLKIWLVSWKDHSIGLELVSSLRPPLKSCEAKSPSCWGRWELFYNYQVLMTVNFCWTIQCCLTTFHCVYFFCATPTHLVKDSGFSRDFDDNGIFSSVTRQNLALHCDFFLSKRAGNLRKNYKKGKESNRFCNCLLLLISIFSLSCSCSQHCVSVVRVRCNLQEINKNWESTLAEEINCRHSRNLASDLRLFIKRIEWERIKYKGVTLEFEFCTKIFICLLLARKLRSAEALLCLQCL